MIIFISIYIFIALCYNFFFLKSNCKLSISILMSLLWGVNQLLSLYLGFLSFMGVSVYLRIGLMQDEDEETSDRSSKK